MTNLQAVILGFIEGLTEFLPISSTGHMIVASYFLNIPHTIELATFEIVIQVGAILAVIVTFYKKLLDITVLKKIIVGFIPTGIIGLLVFPFVKPLLGNPLLVAYTLLIGGFLILITETWYKSQQVLRDDVTIKTLSYKEAALLGFFQTLALIPGVSRSGAVIVGGLWQKLPRTFLVEFTFLLAVPTMLMATSYTLIRNWNELASGTLETLLIGTGVSFIVALIVIKTVLNYIRKYSFSIFGWYRIILGVILVIILT